MTGKEKLKLAGVFVGITLAVFTALVVGRIIEYAQADFGNVPYAYQEAFRQKDWLTYRILMFLGSDIDSRASQYDLTLLAEYADKGKLDDVERILELGADPNAPAHDSWARPLSLAIRAGNDDVVSLLMQRGAEVRFHDAVFMGDADRAQAMLRADPNLLSTTYDPDEFSLLHRAALFGDEETVRLLLDLGADPLQAARHGLTPLDIARERKRDAIIDLLENAVRKAAAMEPSEETE